MNKTTLIILLSLFTSFCFAQNLDDEVRKLMGNSTEEMYGVAADIMPVLVAQANGDSKIMSAILNNASRDAAAFLNSMPQHIKTKLMI
ncbi:MAG: hypothetical protein WA160_13415 [Pseudobdellovibrio sp.]